MKSLLRILTLAVTTIFGISLPLFASESFGSKAYSQKANSSAFFPDADVVSLFNCNGNSVYLELTRSAENPNLYEKKIDCQSISDWPKLKVQIGSTTFGTDKSKYNNPYGEPYGEYNPLPSTPFEFSTSKTDWDAYLEIGEIKTKYDFLKFTVEVTGTETLKLTITEAEPDIPDAPAAGSTITVKNLLYELESNVVDTWTLENSAENPYVFKGSITTVKQYSAITFTYNDKKYAFTRTEYKELPAEVELFSNKTGNVYYKGDEISQKIRIEATLSELQNSMTVKFMLATPISISVNNEDFLLIEDIFSTASNRFDCLTPVSVKDGESSKIAVKIGNKTYGVTAPVSFDATNYGEQIVTADLAEAADAASLNLKGTYSLAVLRDADGYKLEITKAAASSQMTFGEGSSLIFNKESSSWTGTAVLTKNQELPAFTYSVYDLDSKKFITKEYWFPCDIDDPDGVDHTVTLATTDQSANKRKCTTPGTYSLTVTIADDGTATATYKNVAPPVKINDLYVCVYNEHYRNGYNGKFDYYSSNKDEFSTDYKVTYQLEDGSYAIALLMDNGQAFYIMNNGIAYRPSSVDCNSSFGGSVDKMNTFTFQPSDDPSLRKHVSTELGYRMLIIKPNGSNIDVKGYKIDINDNTRMKIIESLASPEDAFGHAADLFIRFTGDVNEGYLNEYRKMQLNPSGTYGLYGINLKAGQKFEVYRGRAKYDDGGNLIGIEDWNKVQYGCIKDKGADYVTMVDGDYTLLNGPNTTEKTTTYSVVHDGEFNFVVFYNVPEKDITLWLSRRVPKDRGIKIAVYDQAGKQQGDLYDMQYKNTNRRNLLSVLVPKGGFVKFGFEGEDGAFEPFKFYNLGHTNEVGYDTKPEEGALLLDRFDALEKDYVTRADLCWYRFRIRLREDNNYYLSYQVIPMPDDVWLYVTEPNSNEPTKYKATAETDENGEKTGHYIFKGVYLPLNAEYYFVNKEDGVIDPDWKLTDGDPGYIWYSAHDSSINLGTDGNPVIPGRWINMFSHLNVGTDYQGDASMNFKKFKYWESQNNDGNATKSLVDLRGIEIDMDIATMSHRFSVDYDGQDYYFQGACAGIQLDGVYHDAAKTERYKFVYHPTTGYYTCFLDYLWGDWFIYHYDSAGLQQTPYYPYNLNNVIHELYRPYYLSDGDNRFVSDFKKETASGTAAEQPVNAGSSGSFKENCMICMAPGAHAVIWGATGFFQGQGIAQTPVYKDVTVVFDPANNVLWLESGRAEGDAGNDNPYGELYLIFTDVEPDEWAESRKGEDESASQGAHWVRLTPDPDQLGRFYANSINFPARKGASHSAYFFSNRLGKTLAETIRYSNSYHAGTTDPTFEQTSDETLYGSVFTKLVFNEDGHQGQGTFESNNKPLDLISTSKTAYASTVYVRRWDDKENAPYEDCILEYDNNSIVGTAGRRAIVRDSECAATGTGESENTTDGPVYVTTTQDEPTDLNDKDFVVRTFASEPFTYDVTVHLGRQTFDLVTNPRDPIMLGIEDLATDAPSAAVIRAAAGHISVTGAKSVSIYTISGHALLLNAPEADLDVAPGIYIIVADGQASKHIL